MDIDEIRRSNIRKLEKEFGAAFLAKEAGMSSSQYYNLRDGAKDSKTGRPRGMRKQTAWKLEDAAGVHRGYLDIPHENDTSQHIKKIKHLWPFETIPIERFMALNEKQKARIEGFLDARIADEIERNAEVEPNRSAG